MTYDSTIAFTLDTICPWTYLAKKRLEAALRTIRAEQPPVTFTLAYRPYQLYPDASSAGEDKYDWYKRSRYNDSEEQMQKYRVLMSAYGVAEGIDFKFGGQVANTLQAHRVIQHFQESKGPEVADGIVRSLYRQYFEEEKHPSARETLMTACQDAGIEEGEASKLVEDEDEGLMETKMAIREQASNGVDAVPSVTFEGKRRDFTLQGAKEVEEYVKTLRSVIKEAQ